jgi:hypothetical protein
MGKYIVHCNTYNKVKILCGACKNMRMLSRWEERFYDKTCYRIDDFEIVGWDGLDSYKSCINIYNGYSDYTVVTFEEFMERENLTNEMVVD